MIYVLAIQLNKFNGDKPIWVENNNITLVDYQYYSDNYVEDSSSRTLLSVLMIMVIIGIAVYALVPFIKSKVIKRFI